VFDTGNHSSDLRSIRQDEGLMEPLESQALDDLFLIFGLSDHTSLPSDDDLGGLMFNVLHPSFLSSPLPSPAFSPRALQEALIDRTPEGSL